MMSIVKGSMVEFLVVSNILTCYLYLLGLMESSDEICILI